jgi:inorganic pyrophosphatase
VIETSKGMPLKLKYDERHGVLRVRKALPLGFTFPFNFGFLPSTLGGDGDPLDVLVLSGHTIPVGCVVLGHLISVLEAEQIERQKKQRNDRLIAVPVEVLSHKPMQPATEFNKVLKTAIIQFFVKYNELQGKTFRPLRFGSPSRALEIVRKSIRMVPTNPPSHQ